MKITNFESYVDDKILARGYDYYLKGFVKELKQTFDHVFTATVQGTDDYYVLVEMGANGQIRFSDCECPYDSGPICKHEVAVFYKIRDMLSGGTAPAKEHAPENVQTNSFDLRAVLNTLSKEQLIDIILHLADEDEALEKRLIYKYSQRDDKEELKMTRKLIKSLVQQYAGRKRFISYRQTFDFAYELSEVLKRARETENRLLALDIALLILKEAVRTYDFADDSAGAIGGVVADTLDLIEEIADEIQKQGNQPEKAFKKIVALSENKRAFDGWNEYRINLLQICLVFADDDKLRKRLIEKINDALSGKSGIDYSEYGKQDLLKLQYHMIKKYDSAEAAENFIYEHLHYRFFREELLKKLLREKNFHKAIEVAVDGEKQDGQYPGLVNQWKQYRYEAYKQLSLKKEQKKLAKELLIGGHFQYYFELKELHADEFDEFYTNLKNELRGDERYPSNVFLKIIEEENDLEELLRIVKNEPYYIESYAEKLLGKYKDEVIEIYEQYIFTSAQQSSNRHRYREVCKKIKKFKDIAGKEKAGEIIEQLMEIHKRRPAFIDELGKIKRKMP